MKMCYSICSPINSISSWADMKEPNFSYFHIALTTQSTLNLIASQFLILPISIGNEKFSWICFSWKRITRSKCREHYVQGQGESEPKTFFCFNDPQSHITCDIDFLLSFITTSLIILSVQCLSEKYSEYQGKTTSPYFLFLAHLYVPPLCF